MFKVRTLDIQRINSIQDLFIGFNPGLNFICGPNGIGKTTILNCITSAFNSVPLSGIFPHNNAKYGEFSIDVEDHLFSKRAFFYIGEHPEDMFSLEYRKTRHRAINVYKGNCINFNIRTRAFEYSLQMVGERFNHIKSWLYTNYYKDEMDTYKFYNLQLVQQCFNLLDPNISFGRITETIITDRHPLSRHTRYREKIGVNVNSILKHGGGYTPRRKSLDMFVNTPHGEVLVECLSSGYKSSLTVLLGIIRGIESSSTTNLVNEFNGIIIIDEIDLHLHPQWQAKLVDAIRKLVPKAQVICTTHSPHIIQAAKPEEVIALGEDVNGNISVKEIPSPSEYGFQGWTIEEILTDVMGLGQTMSPLFIESLEKFNVALRKKDREMLMCEYKKLRKMVHPQNPLATLLSVQAGELMIWEDLK
ncbi:ATP-binding protein [Bacillus cereus]|uniref:AAA family ATPase n=1 Tax=Bacillus cereus TaxID=1396 RepID=UPI000BEF5FC3|nr:ATP-binding protein [Bacillus cereus]PEL97442.1 ATP-binding protein [Bacillus cereus]